MGCQAPLPAGYQLQIANFLAGQLAQKASDIGQARQHVQRAINALGGTHGKHYKTEHGVGFPVHGLGQGDGAIAELAHMMGRRVEGAREAHQITEIAQDILAQTLHKNSISEIQRLSNAASLLVQAAVEVISFLEQS